MARVCRWLSSSQRNQLLKFCFTVRHLSVTELTASKNRPDWETGASISKASSLSLMSVRFNHRCISGAIKPAKQQQIAQAVCLFALSAKSVVHRSSLTTSAVKAEPSSISQHIGLVRLQNHTGVQRRTRHLSF